MDSPPEGEEAGRERAGRGVRSGQLPHAQALHRGAQGQRNGLQRPQTHRPVSPAPSCVSMKSDKSMGVPLKFSSEEPQSGPQPQTHRPVSPAPSCVSMKSDKSMGVPLKFSSGAPQSGPQPQTHRPESPGPSSVSMKSDKSMKECQKFSSRAQQSGLIYQQIHKSHLQKKFQCLIEGISQQGYTRLLHEIYTDLYITEGGRGRVNDEHEVRQIERASWREAAQGRPIRCSDIFKPLSGQVNPIRIVVTKGMAGIGKTVSVQKFILDWAEGTANQDIDFMFPLSFRELNLMKEKKLSLVGLIQHFFPEIKDSRVFTSSEHRVMFILDGLDECRIPLDFHSKSRCCNVTEKTSVDRLITNLIKGNLLPSALLWITTRPAATNQIPHMCVDLVTEIRGFNNPQKEEYFRKRIRDENLVSRTVTHLKSSRSLYIMCHIPVFCWILDTVVEKISEEAVNVEIPRTLTQMYTRFLVVQTSKKRDKYTERQETDEEVIFKLGKLAFQQLEKGNLIFYEEDLRECGIDITEASVYSGVCTQIFREEPRLYHKELFSFVHLTIQEFLAALYVFVCFKNRERSMPDQQQTSQLSALFRAATLHDLHKTAVDLALQSKNGHLDLFLRFLLGFLLESNQTLLKFLLPQSSSQSDSPEQTVQYVKQKIRDQRSSDRRINLFYCLIELNHHAVVEDIDISLGTLCVDMLLPGRWETKRFKFKMSDQQLVEFDLQKYIKTPEKDQTELLSPDEVLLKLLPGVTTFTSVELIDCNLTQKSCSYLASALTAHSSSLRLLELGVNELLDSGVELLCSALRHQNCKLEDLQLWRCNLKEMSCSYLASALISHSSSLRLLDLTNNELLDSGVKFLCEGLRHQNCKLEKLQLRGCKLTKKSCSYLASALTAHPSSLRLLDLRGNELLDSGVEHLCSALHHQNCRLEELHLIGCGLTEESCSYLTTSLTSNSSLTDLDLQGNDLSESAVKQLYDLVEDPHYKLEKLKWYSL
ncbi:NACHT, LRR and PYD domains-containing protein 3-like isoform X2 [Sardina pilchardus]|uniref:NACHT, LRR and PYD domains-containing protein 3-like isoform X2 n=1 Tax=Sardina pilchardus TaxID=27697 RepID=UPI002E1584A7